MDKANGPARSLQVKCSNCGAVFIAYYGADETTIDTVETQSCALCHVDGGGRKNFDDARIRMVAQVLARDRAKVERKAR